VRFDLPVAGPEEMSRDELIVVVRRQAGQITAMAGQLSELMEANEALAGKLARLEHLLSRNSGNSSSPPSKDDDPGKPAPPEKNKRDSGGPKRARGKQPGAAGTHLAWTENPDERRDRFPQGRCDCGDDLGGARDLGIVDRYQQHEIPQVAVKVTQYDQHQVRCGCGKLHTADRPDGARSGPVGYGPHLAAFVVYLMVVHFIPAHRVVALLESLTGTAPSVGFVHGMINRAAGLLTETHQRIRTLITLAHAVSCDETPLRVGPQQPPAGKKKAEHYLLVACTELYTHYLLGDRSIDTFKAFVVTDLTNSVIVHDRYQNYDSAKLGTLVHQLCCAHLLRDLAGAAEVYPDAVWPVQIADALRGLIHHANLAREHDLPRSTPTSATHCSPGSATGHWSDCQTPPRTPPAPGNAKPGSCSKSCATAPTTCCASPTTSRCPPPPTRPNTTYAPARSNRRSPGA
jgi:transposase